MRDPIEQQITLRRRFTRRALLTGAIQTGLLGFLVFRLHDLQVTYSNRYQLLADENRLSEQPTAPVRGAIRDRNGVLLAGSSEEYQVSIIPELAGDLTRVLDELGRIIDVSDEERQRILDTATRQSRLMPVPVKSGLDWQQFAQLNVLAPQLPGIEVGVGWRRSYAHGLAVGHIVGYVGRADRLEVDEAPWLRLPTMRIGKMGVELGMDAMLRGEPGSVVREVDAKGRIVREVERRQAKHGRDVALTIDTGLQAGVIKRMQRAPDFSSVVAMDLANGDILAMASTPVFDPAKIIAGISPQDWQSIRDADGDPLTLKAIRGLYPPGSTFKIVTALAGLEAGVVTPETVFTCTGGLDFGGSHFGCWKAGGHGRVKLHDAIKYSCDVYFYELARVLGIDRLAEAARNFGLGQVHECGIAAQLPGVFPDPAWKMGALDQPWVGGETLLAAIGQGYVLTTPLQLAVMTARVATGRMMAPRLVLPDAGVDPSPVPQAVKVKSEWLAHVREAMRAAVNDGGTGSSAAISGVQLAGKTGTAQVTRESRGRSSAELERSKRDHSLFVCFAPFEAPRFAVAAIVEHGGGGATAAAPIARDVMATLLRRETAPPAAAAPEDDTAASDAAAVPAAKGGGDG